ncbi:futalosine hydrolase [Mucilaginibacter sp. BJC16-A38]|uniref:futalosine hydrolase n=1 Tax=Mucilaginibacter phenanthrenivorans TaxID=1234842 RepID=UPI0021579BBD|nr:futalosine hydrolase [Mucilaginibacter phenanthrenivorans]MCR8559431.1 futalosine hydrolase [Mucilaginibacter phenanthrenivorans]
MRILIVVATEDEVLSLKSEVGSKNQESSARNQEKETQDSEPSTQDSRKTYDCQLLVTGVGMTATAFALGRHLSSNKYDLILNLGIAGSFDRGIALGDVVEITQDTFAELGAEDDTNFLPIADMGFGEATYYPSKKLADLYNLFNTFNLTQATAITVNTVHGNEASIQKVAERLGPQIESMEGAAVFYACKQFDVPCMQIRAVSNYVEKRNRANWNIGLAIKNLNTFAIEFLKLYA